MEPAVSKRRKPLQSLFFGVRIAHCLLMLQDEVLAENWWSHATTNATRVSPAHVWIVQAPKSPTVVSLEGRR